MMTFSRAASDSIFKAVKKYSCLNGGFYFKDFFEINTTVNSGCD
jgi:hypothetical protein